MILRSLTALGLFVGVASLHAQESVPATKSAEIGSAATPPVIDGVWHEEEWAGARLIEDFHQVSPVEYAAASERTQIYVTHDADALYVGARVFDSDPGQITANVLRQGEGLGGEDRIIITLDPFGDGRSGYGFFVNANGVRRQALYENRSEENFNWKGIWDVRTSRDAQGWTAEVMIPFKTLSFDPARTTWGFNVERHVMRRAEVIGWSSRNQEVIPATAGRITGLSGLDQGLGLDVVPSVSLRQHRGFSPEESEFKAEPSLDVFYKVTPALTAALTINTDFSATEVDDREVNLSRFSLFFPEKRAFFLQDADIFEFGRIGVGTQGISGLENGLPFFSRRIGLGEGGVPVDLKVGGKLTGRIGNWSLGVLDVQQAGSGAVDSTNLFVGRAAANVLEESTLGVVVTNGDPRSNLDNTLVGADFRYLNTRLAGGRVLEGELWYQSSETEDVTGDDAAFGVRVRSPNNVGWRGGLGMKELQENFYPALGFVNNRGIQDYTGDVGYTHVFRQGPLQKIYTGLNLQQIDLIDGGLQMKVHEWRAFEIETAAGDAIEFAYIRSTEALQDPFEIFSGIEIPVGEYAFDEFELELEFSNHRRLSGGITYRWGNFFSGSRDSIAAEIVARPSRHFAVAAVYEIDDVVLPQGRFIARLMRLRLDAVFSSTLSWSNFIQYDNDSELIGINSRMQWIPRAGRETYLVVNHGLQDFDRDRRFRSDSADVVLKAGYTFRF